MQPVGTQRIQRLGSLELTRCPGTWSQGEGDICLRLTPKVLGPQAQRQDWPLFLPQESRERKKSAENRPFQARTTAVMKQSQ